MKQEILFIKRHPIEKSLMSLYHDNIDEDLVLLHYMGIEGYATRCTKKTLHCLVIDCEKSLSDSTLGYDVGSLDAEGYSFSSIYQEIIFSEKDLFCDYYAELNKNLLFSNYETAEKYLAYHKELSMNGFDLEHENCLHIYRILEVTNNSAKSRRYEN